MWWREGTKKIEEDEFNCTICDKLIVNSTCYQDQFRCPKCKLFENTCTKGNPEMHDIRKYLLYDSIDDKGVEFYKKSRDTWLEKMKDKEDKIQNKKNRVSLKLMKELGFEDLE